MPGLLDLIAARNPEQAGGLLSDLVAAPRNRLRGLLDNPAGFMNSALREALGADQLDKAYGWRMNNLDAVTGSPDTRASVENDLMQASLNNAMAVVVKNPILEQKALQHFGATYSPKETGYILDNGTRLDFSGRHYASGYQKNSITGKYEATKGDYLREQRNVDHRELSDLLDSGGGSARMNEFIDQTGAVRYSPNTGAYFIDTNMPSAAQIEKIVQDFRRSGDPLLLDIAKKETGDIAASQEFARPTVEQVTNWLRKFIK